MVVEEYKVLIPIWFSIIEASICIIANSLLLLIFVKNPLNNLRHCSSLLICNIALADLLNGFVMLYYDSSYWHRHWDSEHLGQSTEVIMWFSTLCSTFALAFLSLERYLLFKRPLHVSQIITKRRTLTTCAIIWVSSAVLTGALVKKHIAFMLVVSSLLEMAVTIQIVLYIMMWRESENRDPNLPSRTKQQRELTTLVFILLVILIISVFPLMIWYQIIYIHFALNLTIPKNPDNLLNHYLLPLYCVNSLINPFLYGWRLEKFRKSAIALFSGRRRRTYSSFFGSRRTRTSTSLSMSLNILSQTNGTSDNA